MVGGCENEETATTTQSLNRNFGLIILFQLQRYQRITKVTRVEGSGKIEINYSFKFDIISINLHFRGVIQIKDPLLMNPNNIKFSVAINYLLQ